MAVSCKARAEPVEHGVGPQPRDVVDAARLKSGQKRGRRKTRIDAHHRHVAQAVLRAVHNVEDDIERAVGGANIARPPIFFNEASTASL